MRKSPHLRFTAFVASWAANIVFDTLIFALTVYRTRGIFKAHRTAGLHSSLAALLLRDGTFFFMSFPPPMLKLLFQAVCFMRMPYPFHP